MALSIGTEAIEEWYKTSESEESEKRGLREVTQLYIRC
jgi:hypothetical protein